MALHLLIFATYVVLAGWAALGLPTLFQSTGTLVSVLAGATVFLFAAILHVVYVLRLERQEREYELDTVREAVTDALSQLEGLRKQYSDLRVEIADAKYQFSQPDLEAAELLEKEVLQNVLKKLEGLANGEAIDTERDTVKIRS